MRRSRFLMFGVVLAAHLLLIVLIARWRAPRPAPPEQERALVVAQLTRPVPPPPPQPPPRLRSSLEADAPPPPPPAPSAPPPDFSACTTAGAVQAALAGDPRVQQVLATVPAEARSVSNAVTLWDGAWADAAAPGQLDPLRAVVDEALLTQSPDCLDQPMIGPRLFVVAQQGDAAAVSLVIGSGRWQWRDLAGEAESAKRLGSKEKTPRQASIGSHRGE